MIKTIITFIQKNKVLSLIVFLGSTLSLLVIIPSGSHYCYRGACGIFFWGAHEMDAVWHLALINNGFKHIPFVVPSYSGALLSGYNAFLDLIIYLLTKTGIEADIWYFKIMPIVWIISLVFLVFKLTKILKKDYVYTCFLFFFIFFGSTFMYFLDAYHGKGIFGLDSFGGALNLTNLQYSFSLLVLLACMVVIRKMKDSPQKALLLMLLMFLNTALKFYAALITGVFIFTYYFIEAIITKKWKWFIITTFFIGLGALLAIVLMYNPQDAFSGKESVLTFSPLAHSRVIIENPSKLYLHDMVLARYTLLEHGIGPRLIAIETFSIIMYLLFNFGTRIVGVFMIIQKVIKRDMDAMDIGLLASITAGIIMVLLFVQRGQWWNTVQFFYYSLFLMSFFSADFMSALLRKKTALSLIVAGTIIILTMPFNIGVARTFSSLSGAASYISDAELKALNFLRKQPEGIVVSTKPPRAKPEDFSRNYQKDGPYVSAYTHKIAYIESEVMLQLLSVDFQDRKKKVLAMDPSIYKDVDYVYVHNEVGLPEIRPELEEIFHNQEITLYKVHHELIQ